MLDPQILNSARKHGIADIDMLIGPDRNGNLLEIGVNREKIADSIVHAMKARRKFTR